MEKEEEKLRVVMFPWLAHGHILSKKLSTKNFSIYLCSTAVNLDSIKPRINESIQLLELHIPSSPQLPPHLHTTNNLPSNLLPTLLQAFQESTSSFSDIMDSVKPHLLIYDVLQPWAPKSASSRGVPSVHFGTSGATSVSFYHHVHTMGSGSTFPYEAISTPQSEMDRMGWVKNLGRREMGAGVSSDYEANGLPAITERSSLPLPLPSPTKKGRIIAFHSSTNWKLHFEA